MTADTAHAIIYGCSTILAVAGIAFALRPLQRQIDRDLEELFAPPADLVRASLAIKTDYEKFGKPRAASLAMFNEALEKVGSALQQ